MYLLQCRIRVMLLCQHDKKSWDYWHSYLKPTTTTGRTSPQHRGVCSLCAHTVIYACMYAGCMYVCVVSLESHAIHIFSESFKPSYEAVTVKLLWEDLLYPYIKLKYAHWTSKICTVQWHLGLLCTMERGTATIDKEEQCAMRGKQVCR